MSDDRGRQARPRADAVLNRVRQLRSQSATAQYDLPAWEEVIADLNALQASDATRQAFEEVLATFPTAVVQWIRYVEVELSAQNTAAVKQIFGRCLLTCPNIELYTHYLRFVKRSNEGKGAAGLMEVRGAYVFSLDILGNDINSGPLWQEYIQFLQSAKPGSEVFAALFPNTLPGQEESARATAVRKAYQQAIVVPHHMHEALWKQYEAFENAGSRQLARKVLEEWRPRFTAARQTYRERKKKLELLNSAALPIPPGQGGFLQEQQVRLWREYLEYERGNPQKLDPVTLTSRVSLAYDQCLTGLWFFPEVWFEYAHWHANGGGAGAVACVQVLGRAAKALPSCLMLRFALADAEELQGHNEQAKAVYEALVEQLEADAAAVAAGDASVQPVLELGSEQGALAWVQYMRFLRRTGEAIAARQLFLRARRWGLAPHHSPPPWQIYAAAALMEWQFGRDSSVAAKIFEKGLEEPRLIKEPHYIMQYQKFLSEVGDTDNARALFERALSEPENTKSATLWHRYVLFEYELGNVGVAMQVERRATQALGDSTRNALQLALLKFGFSGAWPCTQQQRPHLQRVAGVEAAGTSLEDLVDLAPAAAPASSAPASDPMDAIQRFIKALPHAVALEGPPVMVEMVLEPLLATDLSPEAILRACMDHDSGRQQLGLIPLPGSNGRHDDGYGRDGRDFPPPYYERDRPYEEGPPPGKRPRGDGPDGEPYGPPFGPPDRPPYGGPPHGGPYPPPHHPYDDYGPPPPYEYGPPPGHRPPPHYDDHPPPHYGDGPPPYHPDHPPPHYDDHPPPHYGDLLPPPHYADHPPPYADHPPPHYGEPYGPPDYGPPEHYGPPPPGGWEPYRGRPPPGKHRGPRGPPE
mmetsp:Transcript_30945/g.68528  ORF Transcript_30945/g.68528 Transcript_30945/m.68528 type:complete len:867 (+) Transcript_30945:78-2678(+)